MKERMTPRQRVMTAINHQEPDRVPICVWYTPEAEMKMLRHLGVDVETAVDEYTKPEEARGHFDAAGRIREADRRRARGVHARQIALFIRPLSRHLRLS